MIKNPYLNFDKLKTDEGKLEFKFKLLERLEKKSKYLSHVLNLYFHLNNIEYDKLSEKDKNINKIKNILDDYDYKFYMFENLGHLLPPLNFWDKGNFKFDDWQIDVIKKVKINNLFLLEHQHHLGKHYYRSMEYFIKK